jgi:ADP-ribose pyrophosphatase YjhB (NUDIX family)
LTLTMHYCSQCGSDRLSFRIPESDTNVRIVCENCGKIHYVNPRLIVGCIPLLENKILLCRRAIEPCYGKWNIPAGFMELNETAEEGAIRETLEEAGADVQIDRLHSLYSIPGVNHVYLIFLAHLKDHKYDPGIESLEVKLFSESNLPWDDIAFTSNVFALRKYIENKNNPHPETCIGHHDYDHRF